MTKRRSRRSASTPPARMRSQMGAPAANESSPTRKAESLSLSTNQGSATCCIQLPMLDRRFPTQRMAKFRVRSAPKGLYPGGGSSANAGLVPASEPAGIVARSITPPGASRNLSGGETSTIFRVSQPPAPSRSSPSDDQTLRRTRHRFARRDGRLQQQQRRHLQQHHRWRFRNERLAGVGLELGRRDDRCDR